MTLADRRHHLHILGKTGTGKSSLIRNLLLQDIWQGRGVALIDPHGDLADEIIDQIPSHRINEVVYFNPADTEHPIGINLLQNVPAEQRHLVASGVVESFRSIFCDSWGPRTEYIFYATVAALLECQNVSLLGVPRMLSDERYRQWVLKQIRDPSLRAFWIDEFAQYPKNFQREAVAPIQNKVGQVLLAPIIRNIFGQITSGFNARFMMDNQRIFIASLSKGRLGADKANLLGALLTTQFQLAAMSRASIPELDRSDFFLYVDEYASFATESFASILAEARKYRLGLILAGQHLGQASKKLHDAIFGNVGSHIALRIGFKDAETIAREFGGAYESSSFGELNNYRAYVKLIQKGEQYLPFELETIQPESLTRKGCGGKVVKVSRERFGSRRGSVEDSVQRWSGCQN